MRKKAVIVLADGFEEIEAMTPIDVLRRAGVEVTLAGVGKTEIKSSRGVRVMADVRLEDYEGVPDAVILPGGIPGAENLKNSDAVAAFVGRVRSEDRVVAAICAAPALVLPRQAGLLDGKKFTCYPGMEKEAGPKAVFVKQSVVRDGRLITSQGPGTSMDFALELVRELVDEAMAKKLADAMLVRS